MRYLLTTVYSQFSVILHIIIFFNTTRMRQDVSLLLKKLRTRLQQCSTTKHNKQSPQQKHYDLYNLFVCLLMVKTFMKTSIQTVDEIS